MVCYKVCNISFCKTRVTKFVISWHRYYKVCNTSLFLMGTDCSTVHGLLDWFEVHLELPELVLWVPRACFIQIDLWNLYYKVCNTSLCKSFTYRNDSVISCICTSLATIDISLKWHPQKLIWYPQKLNASWHRYTWVMEWDYVYAWVMSQ